MCSLEGGYGLFQKYVNLGAQKQWAGIKAELSLLLKKLYGWSVTTHHDQLGVYDQLIL